MMIFVYLFLALFSAQAHEGAPDLLRLQEEVALIAQEIKNVPIKDKEPVESAVSKLVNKAQALKFTPLRSEELVSVLNRLQDLFREFLKLDYAREQPRAVVRALARQMVRATQSAHTKEDLIKSLKSNLKLPSADSDPSGPVNLTLEEFRKLDAFTIFLLKRRMDKPSSYAPVSAQDLALGRHRVAVGVVLEGTVERIHKFIGDGDIVFDISVIHCEITPNWTKKYPVALPKNGDRVRVYGWTYYDIFHEDEGTDERDWNQGRPTVWEVHPIHKIEILK